ncbi:MAG: hypothetical protein J0M12_15445 [Deltaproteobacteria bacterium]|nr:hypothetical protein [Deltaproteobacteria bacterium]
MNQLIESAKSEMLKAANDNPQNRSFAALTLRAEAQLNAAVADARLVVDAATRAAGGFAKLSNAGGEEVSPLLDAEFLIEGMRFAKDMVFRDNNRIDIGMGGGKVNKVSRRLFSATEGYVAAVAAIGSVADGLEESFSGFREETYLRAAKGLIALSEWDQGAGAQDLAALPYALQALRALENDGTLSLTLFVCPPVEFGYLQSQDPELYFRTELSESLLSKQVADLKRLFLSLEQSGIPAKLNVLIGDADEDDYIWPVLGRPGNLPAEQLQPRKVDLRENVVRYLSSPAGRTGNEGPRVTSAQQLDVVSLAGTEMSCRALGIYENFVADPAKFFQPFFRAGDVDEERQRMRELWQVGDYYSGLPQPSSQQLERIIERKFAAYAMQGVFIQERSPDTILVQTERPPFLRTRMLNAGRSALGMESLPAIYQRVSAEEKAAEGL